MAHNAAGQVVARDLVIHYGLLGTVERAEKADDDLVHSALANITLNLAVLVIVAEGKCAVDGEVLGMSRLAETLGERHIQMNGRCHSGKGVYPYGIAIFYKADGFFHAYNFAFHIYHNSLKFRWLVLYPGNYSN